MPSPVIARSFRPLKPNSPQMRRVNLDVRATGFRNPAMAQALVIEAKGRAKTAMAQLGFTPQTLEVMVVPDHAKEAGSIGFAGGRIVISPLFKKAGFNDPAVMKALSDAVLKLMNQQALD